MVFDSIVSSPRGNLSLQQVLNLANIYLENAGKAQDPDLALVLCHDTEVSLSKAKKSAKRTEDSAARHEIAVAYIGLGRVLDSRGRAREAQESYKKAEKLGYVVDYGSSGSPTDYIDDKPVLIIIIHGFLYLLPCFDV